LLLLCLLFCRFRPSSIVYFFLFSGFSPSLIGFALLVLASAIVIATAAIVSHGCPLLSLQFSLSTLE
jgi:hypothetical protein